MSGTGAQLSPERARAFALLLQKRGLRGGAPAGIPRRRSTGPALMSFQQERMWFFDRWQPGSAALNLPQALRARGRLEVPLLERILGEVMRRHEALRTSFQLLDGKPVQTIAPAAPMVVPVVDLAALPELRRQTEARRLATREARRPFDLSRGPLLRSSLLRLGSAEQVVLLTTHHIASDGWSTGLLVREVQALYEAYLQGRPSPLPELEIQYADVAEWQRANASSAAADADLAYWKDQLARVPVRLELPRDRPRPPLPNLRAGTRSAMLPPRLLADLQGLCRTREATSFMVLLAAFGALLQRHSGQDDLAVGAPVAGRRQLEAEKLIGFFVNFLVLRVDLTGEPSFLDLLQRVRQTTFDAFAHQDVPIQRVMEEVAPERDPSHSPLFQVALNLLSSSGLQLAPLRLPGLELAPVELGESLANLELSLYVFEGRESAGVRWVYQAELFDAARIQRLAGHFENLLAAAVAEPARPLAALPLLAAAERHQLLVEWNDTARADGAAEDRLHRLFTAAARRRPDAVAVVCGGEEISYGELDRRADCLAARLRAGGVGPEVRVAICCQRSLDMVLAVLAVLKAGGAYVPLDPELPPARLGLILADSGAAALLTQAPLRHRLDGFRGAVICLDGERGSPGPPPGEAGADEESARPDGDGLAYIVYTSGSTGRPKGVLGAHAAAVSYLRFLLSAYGLQAGDRVLQLASLSFDASVRDLLGPLVAGATVVLVDAARAKDPAALVAEIDRQRVRCLLSVVPSLLRALLGAAEERPGVACGTLRLIALSGERLWLADCARARRVFGEAVEVVNQYGPTECTMTSSWHRTAAGGPGVGEAAIGRPIPEARFHVLSGWAPVPMGTVGSLYIGGRGVSRGYLDQPDLTADRFLPDPFGAAPGGRLYATGDRVRHLPDGALEFLGRSDQQVKLRGFRVEPAEVERELCRHPRVRQAAVVVREDGPGDPRLVAYVAADGGGPPAGELREMLGGRLPDYMVPAVFVALDALPLTPNGKLDRRALPEPQQERHPAADAAPAAPRTPVEEILAGIWSDLLRREGLGIHDNFFDLGGHSLLATRVASRVRGAFGIDLPLADLFERPTVARLAEALAERLLAGAGALSPPLARADRSRPLPLSFAQQRLWFLDQLAPGITAYHMRSGMLLEGELDVAALQAALSEVVRRHEVLRTTFASRAGEPAQIVGPSLPVPLPVIDLSRLPAGERAGERSRLRRQEVARLFDLVRGPLLRVALLKLAEREHATSVTVHHIVSDAWSMGLLVHELGTLYDCARQGRPSPLPELPVQYADFAWWQQRWLSGEVLEAELGYWRERLGERPPVLELPIDRPRPAVQTFAGASEPLRLGAAAQAGLRALSREQGATLFMTLLAAFAALLARHSGQDDFVVGTPVAGRSRIEVEPLIGFFVNMLVLRADLAGEPTFAELLARVRQTALSAYAHQDLPFEKLVLELQPGRDRSRSPLFQVVFALQNAPPGELAVAGLTFRRLAEESTTAKFDLSLSLGEGLAGLAGAFEYNRDLFDRSTVRRMARHLTVLLESLPGSFAGGVAELPLLAEAERHQLAVEWNERAVARQGRTAVELLAAQAARRPEKVAVRFGEASLSYRELDARSQRLARRLLGAGVAPGDRVGLAAERSLDLVVAMLAIFKSRGAMLPLDPTYPRERLAFMLADAAPVVVLGDRPSLDALPEHGAGRVVLGEPEAADAAGAPALAGPDPADLAYVIYTSGSTGRPKGVAAEHGSLAGFLAASVEAYGWRPADVMATLASFSFDIFFFELLSPLVAGGCSILIPLRPAFDIERLVDQLGDLTRFNAVPGLMRPVVAAARRRRLSYPCLATLFTGGDVVPTDLLREMREVFPATELRLLYGPTETAVLAASAAVAPHREPLRSPLGRPLGHVEASVRDGGGRPLPIGVVGELWIGGAGVSRGYLHRPELTAEKFVPLSGEPGGRAYRTGDRVRWLADGNLDFLGRLDHQVKLRGFRIELGEIETSLGQHPDLCGVAVLLREDRPGDQRLTAYAVAAEPASPPAVDDLRRFLLARLPDYMVPTAFVFLDALPLTVNAKVDRQALPPPGDRAGAGLADLAAPRDPLELELVGLWQGLLKRQPIGIRDNFFELGGHSLLAVRMIAVLRERLRQDVSVATLFQHGTVEALAAFLRGEAPAAAASRSPLVTLRSTGDLPALFCVHPGGGGLRCYRSLVRHLGPAHPFHGFEARGRETDEEPHARVEEMAGFYLETLRRFQPRGPYHLGGWSLGALVAFEMARRLREEGEEVALLAMIDPPEPRREANAEVAEGDAVATLLFFAAEADLIVAEERLRPLDADERLVYLVGQAIEAGLMPAGAGLQAGVEYLRRWLKVYQAGRPAAERYVPGPYSGPVTILSATATLQGEPKPQDDGGWSRLCSGPVAVHSIPGNHQTILREPNVQAMAEVLHRLIVDAAAGALELQPK